MINSVRALLLSFPLIAHSPSKYVSIENPAYCNVLPFDLSMNEKLDHADFLVQSKEKLQSYTTKYTNNNVAIVGHHVKLSKLGFVSFAKFLITKFTSIKRN